MRLATAALLHLMVQAMSRASAMGPAQAAAGVRLCIAVERIYNRSLRKTDPKQSLVKFKDLFPAPLLSIQVIE